MSASRDSQLLILDSAGAVSESSPGLDRRLGRAVPVGTPLSDVLTPVGALPACGVVQGVLLGHEDAEPVEVEVTPLGRGGSVLRVLPPPPDASPEPALSAVLLAALDAAPDPIAITTADLSRPGPQFVYVNRAFEDLTGYDRAEIVGRTPRLLQGAETDRPTLDRLRRRLAAGAPFHGATVNYRKDGTSYALEWKIAPVPGPGGRPSHWVTVQRDVTARVHAEHAVLTAAATRVVEAERARRDADRDADRGPSDPAGRVEGGLLIALRALAVRAERETGVPVMFSFDRLAVAVSPSAERTLYTVAQETTTDAVGQAPHAVHLGLTTLQGPPVLTVTVRGAIDARHPARLPVLERYAQRHGHAVGIDELELGGYRLSCTASSEPA